MYLFLQTTVQKMKLFYYLFIHILFIEKPIPNQNNPYD